MCFEPVHHQAENEPIAAINEPALAEAARRAALEKLRPPQLAAFLSRRLLADSVAKLPKCRGINFPEIDQTAIAERCSLQAITEDVREFIAGRHKADIAVVSVNVRCCVPAQPVDATQALNLSAGVLNCKVSRGRSLS